MLEDNVWGQKFCTGTRYQHDSINVRNHFCDDSGRVEDSYGNKCYLEPFKFLTPAAKAECGVSGQGDDPREIFQRLDGYFPDKFSTDELIRGVIGFAIRFVDGSELMYSIRGVPNPTEPAHQLAFHQLLTHLGYSNKVEIAEIVAQLCHQNRANRLDGLKILEGNQKNPDTERLNTFVICLDAELKNEQVWEELDALPIFVDEDASDVEFAAAAKRSFSDDCSRFSNELGWKFTQQQVVDEYYYYGIFQAANSLHDWDARLRELTAEHGWYFIVLDFDNQIFQGYDSGDYLSGCIADGYPSTDLRVSYPVLASIVI